MNIAKRPAPPDPLLRLFAKLEPRTDAEADSRRFPFVCSTDVRDRNGRIVAQDWELEAYLKNPIVQSTELAWREAWETWARTPPLAPLRSRIVQGGPDNGISLSYDDPDQDFPELPDPPALQARK